MVSDLTTGSTQRFNLVWSCMHHFFYRSFLLCFLSLTLIFCVGTIGMSLLHGVRSDHWLDSTVQSGMVMHASFLLSFVFALLPFTNTYLLCRDYWNVTSEWC